MMTLKREECYAIDYESVEPLQGNAEKFILRYCTRTWLHSASGYRSLLGSHTLKGSQAGIVISSGGAFDG